MNNTLTKEEILATLREQKDFLHEKFFVKRIGIFGSFARNEATEKSDIDFLVEFDAPLNIYISNRYQLSDYLENLFHKHVDLANPKSLKPLYKSEILINAIYA